MKRRIAEPRRDRPGYLVLVLLAAGLAGCQPGHYRRQADADAYHLIEEKAQDPRWALTDYAVTPDPRSRIFDPFDPDHEPMPPDDPESHRLMHEVDGKKGFKHWHDNGDTPAVDNPDWLALLPLNEDGVLVLDAERAAELARRHSREYQRYLQQLYLSALDVSYERFRFDSLFFGGYQTEYRSDGALRNSDGSRSYLTAATFPTSRGIRMEKLGTTGTELVVGFANSLVWQFSGSDSYSATSVLDFSLVQPLLRFAGRARVLEGLTQSERTLLSNVRQMERYRHGFYLEIMTGVDAGGGPTSNGGGVDSSLLQGLSGTGAGGFMGLLQTQQEILNQRFNLYALRSNYFRLNSTLQDLLSRVGNVAARAGEGGGSNSQGIVGQRLQVAQARQAILNAESRLNDVEVAYQRRLDDYKMSLGLPPTLCVKIEDRMLEPLNLIDRGIVDLQERVSAASRDRTALIWNVEAGRPHTRKLEHEQSVINVRFSPDSRQLLTVDYRGLRLWDVATGRPLTVRLAEQFQLGTGFQAASGRLIFTPDGLAVFLAGDSYVSRMLHIPTPPAGVPAASRTGRGQAGRAEWPSPRGPQAATLGHLLRGSAAGGAGPRVQARCGRRDGPLRSRKKFNASLTVRASRMSGWPA